MKLNFKKVKKIIIISSIFFGVILSFFIGNKAIVWYFQGGSDYFKTIKAKCPRQYYYFEYDSTVRDALFIEDIELKDSLVNYYQNLEKGNEKSCFFYANLLPKDTVVYVIEYLKEDPNIAKVLFDYRIDVSYEDNKIVYVYSKLLHNEKYKANTIN